MITNVIADLVVGIAREVVESQSLPVTVLGAVPTGGGSRYIEIVYADDRDDARSPHQLGVFGGGEVEDVRRQIAQHFHQRVARPSRRTSALTPLASASGTLLP